MDYFNTISEVHTKIIEYLKPHTGDVYISGLTDLLG